MDEDFLSPSEAPRQNNLVWLKGTRGRLGGLLKKKRIGCRVIPRRRTSPLWIAVVCFPYHTTSASVALHLNGTSAAHVLRKVAQLSAFSDSYGVEAAS